MGSARREFKIVAGIALLAVSVAVAAAVFLSTSLGSQVESQRSVSRDLRASVATLNNEVATAEEQTEDAERANGSLKRGYKQCQNALELTQEFMVEVLSVGPDSSDADVEELEDLGAKLDKATVICLATHVDLVDTY